MLDEKNGLAAKGMSQQPRMAVRRGTVLNALLRLEINRPLSGGEPALDVRQIPDGGPVVDLVAPRHGCRVPPDEGRWSFEPPIRFPLADHHREGGVVPQDAP